MKKLSILTATGCALVTISFSGCETPTQGAGTGAAAGAIIGGIAGGNIRSAAIGAGAGALTGAAIGQSNKEQAIRRGYYY
ncbi:MAG: glycine zipper domain-containing protein [Verrucomicrobia bacterium]|nr:glycine zipper domain-containing protein [Verrucomicrobiota bacterium]